MRPSKRFLLLLPFAALMFALPLGFRAAFAQDAGQVAASQPTVDGTLQTAIAAGDELGLAQRTLEAVQKGDYAPAAVIGLILLVLVVRQYGQKAPWGIGAKLKWINTDRGGVAFTLGTSVLAGIAHTLIAGQSVTGNTIKWSLGLAIAGMGGFVGVKRALFPSDKAVPADTTDVPTQPNANKPGA